MSNRELDIVRRALVLRKKGRIGILLAEDGRYWIAPDEFDPWGSKIRITLDALELLVAETESKLPRPPQSEKSNGEFDPKISVYFQNKSIA